MFMQDEEQEFFLKYLNKTQKVLEYGSGESTNQIAERVHSLISIEHQSHWYKKIYETKKENITLILAEPDAPYIEGGDCGSYDQFKSYINASLQNAPYDIILIDGRARVECAKICHKIATKNTKIFIHDFERQEYQCIKDILEFVDIVKGLAVFKIKSNDKTI